MKDRRERCLDFEETRTYCRIVTALGLTIDLQQEIDTLYPAVEKDVLTLSL